MDEPLKWKRLIDAFNLIRLKALSGSTLKELENEICIKHVIPNTQLSAVFSDQWINKTYHQRWDMLAFDDWVLFENVVPDLIILKCLHF